MTIVVVILVLVIMGYSCLQASKQRDGVRNYFTDVWIMISALVNVFGREIWNKVFIKRNGYRFGSRRDRFGYVVAINKRLKTLTKGGLWVARILNFFNKNHLEKTIKNRRPCS